MTPLPDGVNKKEGRKLIYPSCRDAGAVLRAGCNLNSPQATCVGEDVDAVRIIRILRAASKHWAMERRGDATV